MPWVALIGAGLSAAGQIKQGQDTKSAFDYNADISTMNAAITEEQIRRKYGRLKGTQEATNAASGMAESGSFLEVMADQAYEAEKDALLARWTGKTQSTLDEEQGKNAQTAGYIKGFGTLLGGASNFGQMKYGARTGVTNGVIDTEPKTRWRER